MAASGGADRPAHPVHPAGHLGASSKAGRTGSLNFRVCAGGGERAEQGAISHASPPRRPGALPTRLPRASRPGGARGVEGALSARLGRRGESSLMRDKRGGGGGTIFFNVLKTNSFRRAPPAPPPAAPPPGAPTHPPGEPLPTPIRGLVAAPRRWNRMSSHVSRSRAARPAPPPPRGGGARAPNAGAGLPAAPAGGRWAWCWRAGARAPAVGPRGGPLGVRSWFGARGVLLFF